MSAAIASAIIVHKHGAKRVSLSSVFDDADGDNLTVAAASSDEAVATVSLASDRSTLTVTARSRGAAIVTVTASDGSGGLVDDAFTVTVKSAPGVASDIVNVSGLEAGSTQQVSLSGVFSDADGDSLTITASSDDEAVATVPVSSDGSTLTVTGVSAGDATITVAARDSDGNRVLNAFAVSVVAAAEPEPEAETGAPDIVSRYDANGNGVIDIPEYLQARRDYANGVISAAEWQLVLNA